MATVKKRNNVVQIPPDWKSAFQGHAMKTSFCLALTQPMLELLSAVADDAAWDRGLYFQQYGLAKPDSMLSTSAALIKRGLIVDLSAHEKKTKFTGPFEQTRLLAFHRLTPAGEALVALLKVTGIFVTSDASLMKREAAI